MKLIAYFPLNGRHSKLTRQRAILDDFVEMKGASVLDEFIETEPGLEQLREAIAAAQEQKAFLLFVTLGRYARNLKVLDLLAQSDVEFVTPETRSFTRRSLGVLLQKAHEDMHERSDRIKKAMEAAAKKNGEKYGSLRPGHWTKKNNHKRGWKKANQVAIQKRAQRCADAYATILPEIATMVDKGDSYAEIAKALNEAGHVTTTGSPFSAPTVFKIFKRLRGLNGTPRRKVGRQAALAAAE